MTGGLSELSFGFAGSGDDEKSREFQRSSAPPDRCVGLGQGTGGQISRSCLGLVGAQTLKDIRAGFQAQVSKEVEPKPLGAMSPSSLAVKAAERETPISPHSPSATPRAAVTGAMFSFSEPQGMWYSLLVNDMGPSPQEDLDKVVSHRWSFQGALELASQGKSICYFILCLLEIQRNIQMDQEGEALHPSLLDACKTFVRCQCREGKMGEMYQVLTHFISNSLIFFEWERFLNEIFQDARAHQERFLAIHLEQVWTRYKRLKDILEAMFDYLDANFTWRHRLPKASSLPA
ncbi:unnamed protein product [Symbiodinium pilosum]|uniref:Uncharacterized protein n=1 Tax=Symbiodinium pilosum TaxID=2952 RepID=A0A812RRF1_SYMPI|nr:unnamed protein product [Symbiodinium pilosum]